MDAAWALMQRLLDYPLAECGERLAMLPPLAREARVEIDFPPGKKRGQFERTYALRESLAAPLFRVAAAMRRRGWRLRLEDAYRPLAVQSQGATSEFVLSTVLAQTRWELGGAWPTAEFLHRRLACWTAIVPKYANHTSGSAFDVTILDAASGEEIDRGGVYPEFTLRTPMDSPFVSPVARRHRQIANELFAAEGFHPYPFEFWHYSRGDVDAEWAAGSGRPGRYGPVHWHRETGEMRPEPDILRPLLTVAQVERWLEGADRK
ncbi:MAG: M15 family metallopeptidase [Lentisphaeria bacterium]|nr:M15 family metallopeptidase [Lentisphaeria bacterium]